MANDINQTPELLAVLAAASNIVFESGLSYRNDPEFGWYVEGGEPFQQDETTEQLNTAIEEHYGS